MQFKKSKLVSRLACLGIVMASGHAMAQAAPEFTWYGRIDMGVENNDDGKLVRNLSQSYGSRLGIKGEKRLKGDLTGIFQVETSIAADDTANSKAFASRNSFVGLKADSWGRFLMGTYDMPLKDLQGTAGPMYGSADALEVVVNGKGTKNSVATASQFANIHTRQTNVVHYTSPKFSNVVVKAAYGLDEPAAAVTTRAPVWGTSVEYDDGTWNAGLAFENKENATNPVTAGTAPFGNLSARKLTVGGKWGDFTAGLALSTIDNGLNGTVGRLNNNWVVATTYKVGDLTYKGTYGASTETQSGAADDYTMVALGVDYALDKTVTLYGYWTQIVNNSNGKARFEAGENKYSPVGGDDPRVLGVGIRYNF
ncbi:porin [Rhodoferax saidenbachensis]|uniref:Porin domain-containing protein n=1 Tax=Rhodoferax saidenbachensis TaxID=1484693 RepID=A0A1P8KDS2_9BURK|nr:porin [Rhodoferax saidenbachensis]APW44122.1 hypothetical protein RS694_17370 [Rhodoferax saidenbachensis]